MSCCGDGETPFDADGELVLESECKAKAREIVDEQSASPDSPSVLRS